MTTFMKVYFDARMIDHPGIGRYIRCLLHLMINDNTMDIWLLGNRVKIKKLLGVEKNIIDFDYPIYSIQEQIGFLKLKKMIDKCQSVKVSKCQGEGYVLHVPHYNIPVLAKFNLVATVHDLIHIAYPEGASGCLAPFYMKFMMSRILKSSKAVICVSQATKNEIEKRFIREKGVRPNQDEIDALGQTPFFKVIYEGVDKVFGKITDLAYLKSIKEKYRLPDKFILYVGSIRRHKNIGTLLDSFSRFKKRVPDAQLVMVGRRSQDIDIKRNGVTYLGEVESDKELAAIYNLASCLFNLSLYEGFGLTILEAQKCGLPVVCSDIPVHKEIGGEGIIDIKASYIDPSARPIGNRQPCSGPTPSVNRTIDQICDNLYNILFNKDIRESLILRGLKNADRFDWNKTAQDTIEMYKSVGQVKTCSTNRATEPTNRKIGDESSDSSRLASGDAGRGKDPQCLL